MGTNCQAVFNWANFIAFKNHWTVLSSSWRSLRVRGIGHSVLSSSWKGLWVKRRRKSRTVFFLEKFTNERNRALCTFFFVERIMSKEKGGKSYCLLLGEAGKVYCLGYQVGECNLYYLHTREAQECKRENCTLYISLHQWIRYKFRERQFIRFLLNCE